jgi:hypothetical protein
MSTLINPDHPIKEFAEEHEPKIRQCLFCSMIPPARLPTDAMIYKWRKGNGWYSNAGLKNGIIARFYVCRKHFHLIPDAWDWVAEGFINMTVQL